MILSYRTAQQSLGALIYLSLCLCEGAIFLALVSLYRAATRPDFTSFLSSNPGRIFVFCCIIIVCSIAWVIFTVWQSTTATRKTAYLWIGMNVVTVVIMFGSAELLARLLSIEIAVGRVHHIDETHHVEEKLFGHTLYPTNWSRFAGNIQKVINRMGPEGSYLVNDPVLGWKNGHSRTDKTGRYFSSVEGLRSPRAGMLFSDLRTRHSTSLQQPATIRVAIVGDSFSFGDEVLCEESWGHILETLLQPHAQVLNFGVNAYGLSQAFLRYERDVRVWKPQIVVIGIISEMIKRSVNIYPILQNPDWDFPFARPKLVITNGKPIAINVPIPDAETLFAFKRIDDLPFLNLDEYYRPYLWERGGLWSLPEKSYFFRFAYSFRAPGDDQEAERSEHALQISSLVMKQLVHEVVEDGAIPLVVYLPIKDEMYGSAASKQNAVPLAIRLFQLTGIEYVDPSRCLKDVSVPEAFLRGGHYSPQSNAEVARCVESAVQGKIAQLKR
jgi:hypothetical protein